MEQTRTMYIAYSFSRLIVFYAIYLVFVGNISLFSLVTGLFSSTAAVWICHLLKCNTKRPSLKEKAYFILKFGLKLLPNMVKDILISSILVSKKAWEVNIDLTPCLKRIETDSEDEAFISMLSWCITVTPGTLTLALDANTIVMHSLTSPAQHPDIEKALIGLFNIKSKNLS